jgi:hypothetical protein
LDPTLLFRAVREVSTLVDADNPQTITQRAFDSARAQSAIAAVPPAKRIVEQLNAKRGVKRLTWRKVLALAHAPDQDQENATGPQEKDTQTWLTDQQIVFALKLVAIRLSTNALGRERYMDELRKMAGEGIQVEQLSLPSDQQIIRAMARKLRQRELDFPARVRVDTNKPSKSKPEPSNTKRDPSKLKPEPTNAKHAPSKPQRVGTTAKRKKSRSAQRTPGGQLLN